MDPDSIFRQHQSQDQSQQEDSAGQINIKNIRERFLNALKEVERLEKIIENKNKLLTTAEKEKERLLQRLNMALEDKKRLYNRLADFDIVRNMEILELKQEAKRMVGERKRLLKENESLIEEVFEKDKTIDELRFQLQEAQINLDTAIETLKRVESKYNNLEADYKAIEQERDDLKEKLSGAIELQEYEDSGRLEEYKRFFEMAASEKEAIERELTELLEIREELEREASEYQATIKKLTAEKDELNLKLGEANKELALFKKENASISASLTQKAESETEYLNKIEELNNVIADLKMILDERMNENVSLKNEIILLEEKKKEGDRLNNEIINLKEALQLKYQEIEDLKSKYEAAERQLSEALQSIRSLEDVETEYRNKIEELNKVIANLRVTIEEKISENNALRNEIEDQRRKYEIKTEKFELGRPEEIEKITEKEMIYVEPRRFRWIKKVTVGIVVLIIFGIGGMLIVDRFDIIERISFQKSTSPPVEKPWLAEGPRQINIKDFTVTLTYLKPELPENIRMLSEIPQEQVLQNYYYLLEIKPIKIFYGLKAENNCIPEDFINSLSDRCSFISSSGILIKTKVPEGIDTGRKIIYRTHACDEKRGAIFFRHFLYIEKNYKPQGIMIEGLAKNLPVIIR